MPESIPESLPCVQAVLPDLPESPHSMNAFVPVPGLPRDVQVTARGWTAAEAADALFDGIAAIRARAGIQQAEVRDARLLTLMTTYLDMAVRKEDFARVKRLHKAVKLIQAGAISQDAPDSDIYFVLSQTEPSKTVYTVVGKHCDCADGQAHTEEPTYRCKHSLACWLYDKVQEPR